MINRSNRRIRNLSQRQEKQAAKDVGGYTVAGSGAAKFSGGGDVRKQGELRIECKYTEKDYYDLKLSELKKIKLQALHGGLEQAVMQLEFVSGSSSWKCVILPALRNDALRQFKSTANRQARLHRDELMGFFLESSEGVQVVFLEEPKGTSHVFTIVSWHVFLFGVDEDDPRAREHE